MATYVMLCNLTDHTRRNLNMEISNFSEVIGKVGNEENRVLSVYAVLGRYDVIAIAEAVDNQSAAQLSIELTNHTGMDIETLPTLGIGLLANPLGVVTHTPIDPLYVSEEVKLAADLLIAGQDDLFKVEV